MTARSFSYAPAVLVALWTTSTVGLGPDIDPTWLSFDAPAKTVRFQLIAGLTGLNGALNFNGFRDGGLTLVVPAIPRAFTLRLNEGLVSEATDTLRFTAQPAGEYLIFCGVSGHGAAGMWIRFRVSATAEAPALLATTATSH